MRSLVLRMAASINTRSLGGGLPGLRPCSGLMRMAAISLARACVDVRVRVRVHVRVRVRVRVSV